MINKVYLGDGVYADCDGHGIVLTTENGVETTNTIYLEPEVLEALENYVNRLKEYAQEQQDQRSYSPGEPEVSQ